MKSLSLLILSLPLLLLAHKEPTTDREIEIQRSLQAAAYHVGLRVAPCLLIISPPSSAHPQ
jgi:hypothetical protein